MISIHKICFALLQFRYLNGYERIVNLPYFELRNVFKTDENVCKYIFNIKISMSKV